MKKKPIPPRSLGESNGSAKLTATQVAEIRASKDNLEVLAKKYFVSQMTVSNIRNRKTWTHLEDNDA